MQELTDVSYNYANLHDSQADEIRKPFECSNNPPDCFGTIETDEKSRRFVLHLIPVPIEKGSKVELDGSMWPHERSVSTI